jgi:cellulose synthase/poly-beta-1,6-N-acetylglucosamine synthase-like glycosyltransferase
MSAPPPPPPLLDSDVAGAYPAIRFAPPPSSSSLDGASQQQQHQQQQQHHHPAPHNQQQHPPLPGAPPQLYGNSPRTGASNPFHRILIGGNSGSASGGGGGAASAAATAAAAAHRHAAANGRAAAAVAPQQQQPPRHPNRPSRDISYGPRAPIRRDFSWVATLILLSYLGSLGFYCYVRVMMLLPSAGLPNRWYSALIFAVELLGATAVLPYALLNTRHLHSTGSPGLPEDADGSDVCTDAPFHVRVLIPCYNEPLDIVSATLSAALDAPLPPSTTRSVYLCDDGKRDALRAWVEATYGTVAGAIHPAAPPDHPRAVPRVLGVGTQASLAAAAKFPGRDRVYYVADRVRAPGEINGKSANLNNCLVNWIYRGVGAAAIPPSEVVVVFDADMVAARDFFLKALEPMIDPALALCLTPQGYTNIFAPEDIFNNANKQWWQYSLPGLCALGYVACTGTNFCIRARALADCGWFPTYTITEDFALGMELCSKGYKGTYLNSYLAAGEAPTELRAIFRQRSRWTKGHFQIALSRRNPLWRKGLPPLQRFLYNNGTWSYVVTVVTTPVFVLVPFLSVFANLDPVRFGGLTPLALTLYLASGFCVQHYCHTPLDSQALWLATLSNQLLSVSVCPESKGKRESGGGGAGLAHAFFQPPHPPPSPPPPTPPTPPPTKKNTHIHTANSSRSSRPSRACSCPSLA